MVAESYVTLFVAGPLFLIIIMVVMGMLGGSAVLQLSLVIYAIMPIGSLIFILLIDLISSESGEGRAVCPGQRSFNTYADVQRIKKTGEMPLFDQLGETTQIPDADQFTSAHPFESFVNDVNHTLLYHRPGGDHLSHTCVIETSPTTHDPEPSSSVIDAHVVIAVLIVLNPLRDLLRDLVPEGHGIQALIPDFLERMAGINRSA